MLQHSWNLYPSSSLLLLSPLLLRYCLTPTKWCQKEKKIIICHYFLTSPFSGHNSYREMWVFLFDGNKCLPCTERLQEATNCRFNSFFTCTHSQIRALSVMKQSHRHVRLRVNSHKTRLHTKQSTFHWVSTDRSNDKQK